MSDETYSAENDASLPACGCGFRGCRHAGVIPLPRDQWPSVGDEVLLHHGDGSGWSAATVVAVAEHDGDLDLDPGDGIAARDVKHRAHPYGWLLYDEAVIPPRSSALAENGGDK